MLKSSQLKVVGLHALLYFVCVCVAVVLDLFVFKTRNMYYTPGVTALLAGVVYMSLLRRTRAFGAVSLVGLMMSVFFFLSGHFIWAFVPSLVCGLLADFIALQGRYQNSNLNLTSYLVFSFGNIAPIVTMWLAPQAYAAQLLAKGKTEDYIQAVMVPATAQHVGFQLIFITGLAIVSGYIGHQLVKRKLG